MLLNKGISLLGAKPLTLWEVAPLRFSYLALLFILSWPEH